MTYTAGTGRGKRITPEGRREIIRRTVAGHLQQDIAADMGLMQRSVAKVCAEQGVYCRDFRYQQARDAVAELIRDGYTSSHIMRVMRVCRETVNRVRVEIGLPARIGRPRRNPDIPRLQDIALGPMKREPRPTRWATPKPSVATEHLATGRTPWRCDCTAFGVRVTGPTCPQCQTAAPWAALMEAA